MRFLPSKCFDRDKYNFCLSLFYIDSISVSREIGKLYPHKSDLSLKDTTRVDILLFIIHTNKIYINFVQLMCDLSFFSVHNILF